MKSKLETYALSVCFATTVCLVISGSFAGYALFKIATPELTMRSYEYDRYQSNDAYWKGHHSCSNDKQEEKPRPSEEELTKQRLEAYALELAGERREGFQGLIQCVMFLLAGGITLFIHWKIAQKAREG